MIDSLDVSEMLQRLDKIEERQLETERRNAGLEEALKALQKLVGPNYGLELQPVNCED
jgi:hypothetical protein